MPVIENIGAVVTKVGEASAKALEKSTLAAQKLEVVKPNFDALKSQRFDAIKESNKLNLHDKYQYEKVIIMAKENLVEDFEKENENIVKGDEGFKTKELTEDEKAFIIKESKWPPEIVECIESLEQYEVYKKAELHYAEIDGRPCLVKDINWDYVDPKSGLTNRELVEKKRVPFDARTGEKIELHHAGQNFNSPLIELCENSEHGDGNDKILHDKKIESWRRDPVLKSRYQSQMRNHWKIRAMEG